MNCFVNRLQDLIWSILVPNYVGNLRALNEQIVTGNDPIPVWPYGEGSERGLALKPLYPSVPEAIAKHTDPLFYDLLTLIDAIRSGRVRERQIAAQKISTLLRSKN